MPTFAGTFRFRKAVLPLLVALLCGELWLATAALGLAWSQEIGVAIDTGVLALARVQTAVLHWTASSIWSVADLLVLPATLAAFWYVAPARPRAEPRPMVQGWRR